MTKIFRDFRKTKIPVYDGEHSFFYFSRRRWDAEGESFGGIILCAFASLRESFFGRHSGILIFQCSLTGGLRFANPPPTI